MDERKRLRLLLGLGAVLLVAAVLLFLPGRKPQRLAPNASGYYTGPMRSKGDRSIYSTEDGRVVPPPAQPEARPKPPPGERAGSV